MKKALFIDRDGTIIIEPADQQIDSLEKLEFYRGAITGLKKIIDQTDYELVMVTNQDGLGTDSFPEETFWPAHNMMLKTLAGEGVVFHDIIIDKTFEHEKKPTRKPGTALLSKYMGGNYDLANSYVIGDRLTDIELAKNLGAKGILINDGNLKREVEKKELQSSCAVITVDWGAIVKEVSECNRKATIKRITKETTIRVEIDLDGTGTSSNTTGISFFDHMLDQLSKHGGIDLLVHVNGDLHIDEHHTIEDTGLALGEAFIKALGDKRGIERYGFCLPMDDCLAQVALDFGGRPWIVWEAEFKREMIGEMPTEMFFHFFKSFSDAAKCNLNIQAEGTNEHHKIEAIFKAFAKAMKMAIRKEEGNYSLPTTKGVL